MAQPARTPARAAPAKQQAIQPAAKTVGQFLEAHKAQLLKVIPRHMDPERLMRVALSCISRSKQLQQATTESLVKGIVQSAVLGLELDVNGEAYLLPFRNGNLSRDLGRDVYEATFIPGYKGYIKLARQSREVESIHTGTVYDQDEFDFDEGDRAFVHHKRRLRTLEELQQHLGQNAPPIPRGIAYYCATRMKGAQYPQVRVLDPFEVEQARMRSRARDSGPWVTDYDAMALKTVVRRAAKTWPAGLNPNLTRALVAEDRGEQAVDGSAPMLEDMFPELDAIDVTPTQRPAAQQQGDTAAQVEKELAGGPAEPGSEG